MPNKTSSLGTYFVVFVLLAFFLILYASFDLGRTEKFAQQCARAGVWQGAEGGLGARNSGLNIDPNRMEVYQGVPIPEKYKPTKMDVSDPSNPSVDGSKDGAKSMYMFSYNKCAPECCKDSPYSCDRGCVCLTPNQYEFIGKRGDNKMPNGCDLRDDEF
jgi:hypothetical protein